MVKGGGGMMATVEKNIKFVLKLQLLIQQQWSVGPSSVPPAPVTEMGFLDRAMYTILVIKCLRTIKLAAKK